MHTVKAHTKSPQTNLRHLRKILHEVMASAPLSPISSRIRETRERLLEQAKADGGRELAAEFSQEAIARKIGISLGAYRAYELGREPDYGRRRQIAKALGFSEDYFEVSDGTLSEERVRQIFREELGQIQATEEKGRQQLLDALAELEATVSRRRRR